MYLNVYVPVLQTAAGTAWFFREVRGNPVPSSALMAPMTSRFVAGLKRFAADSGIELVRFECHERKDDRTKGFLRGFQGAEGVLYIGVAQEKARVVRTERRHDPLRPVSVAGVLDGDGQPLLRLPGGRGLRAVLPEVLFLLPVQRQAVPQRSRVPQAAARREGIAFEALDNGILDCADPERMQALADGLDTAKVHGLLRKWLARLPHPFTADNRARGIRHDISMLQAEFALTQVFDRPVQGRVCFDRCVRTSTSDAPTMCS